MLRTSIVSCVNDFDKYDSCLRSSFRKDCEISEVELIPIDNTCNSHSAPAALNMGLAKAAGEIIVFCHQDVVFPERWIRRLYEQISIIERTHKDWGVLGTFGIAKNGMLAGHIIDCSVHFHCRPLPTEVQSLDEHCLIVRKDTGLVFDEDLGGFHLYGADICLQALAKGLANFAIDAYVHHLSPGGKLDAGFHEIMNKLYQKWREKNPPLPVIQTTCKLCRLQSGLRGRIAYEIARTQKKRRRKKVKELLKTGLDFRNLRHDSI